MDAQLELIAVSAELVRNSFHHVMFSAVCFAETCPGNSVSNESAVAWSVLSNKMLELQKTIEALESRIEAAKLAEKVLDDGNATAQ